MPPDTIRSSTFKYLVSYGDESYCTDSGLPTEELDEIPNEQGLREQRRAAIPTQNLMCPAMATPANGSVGELVVPDSDLDRNKKRCCNVTTRSMAP